jgi:hypothetical protein
VPKFGKDEEIVYGHDLDVWLGVNLRTDIKRYMFKRDQVMCSEFVSHYKRISQHN